MSEAKSREDILNALIDNTVVFDNGHIAFKHYFGNPDKPGAVGWWAIDRNY